MWHSQLAMQLSPSDRADLTVLFNPRKLLKRFYCRLCMVPEYAVDRSRIGARHPGLFEQGLQKPHMTVVRRAFHSQRRVQPAPGFVSHNAVDNQRPIEGIWA